MAMPDDPEDDSLGRYYGMDGKRIGLATWTRMFEDPARLLRQEVLPNGTYVSTVWLGLDHRFGSDGPPLIFETMSFKGWWMEFWSKADRSGGVDACWPWQGHVAKNGYGRVHRDGTQQQAHRVAWELFNFEEVPEGLVVHHECGNRRCVNPKHLRVVTHRENLMLDDTPARRNAEKTHCPHGHEYTEENTRISRGRRVCIECSRAEARERYRRKVQMDPSRSDLRDLDMRRYATREQALEGHAEMVAKWSASE